MSPWGPLAEFQDRVLSGLIDYAGLFIIGQILMAVSNGVSFTVADRDPSGLYWLGFVLVLASLAEGLFNGYLAGTTGQSLGMRQSGLRMVDERTGQLAGGGQGLVRNLLLVPALCCCNGLIALIDALFPLWDPKKQTLRDKIAKTIVLKQG